MFDSEAGRVSEYIERHFGLTGSDARALLEQMSQVHLAGNQWLFHQGEEYAPLQQ